MKKEFIYFIIALMLFCVGFLLGKTQNSNGRYFKTNSEHYYDVFDTKTGLIYRTGFENNKRWFQKLDLQNGTKEDIIKK